MAQRRNFWEWLVLRIGLCYRMVQSMFPGDDGAKEGFLGEMVQSGGF